MVQYMKNTSFASAVIIILCIIIIWHLYEPMVTPPPPIVEKSCSKTPQIITFNFDDGIQLFYKRDGIYNGTFNQQIHWYDIHSGDKEITLVSITNKVHDNSRAYDYTWNNPKLIVKVPPFTHVRGYLKFPVKKIGLIIK